MNTYLCRLYLYEGRSHSGSDGGWIGIHINDFKSGKGMTDEVQRIPPT